LGHFLSRTLYIVLYFAPPDHAAALRLVYKGVSEKLEAQGVARNMFQCNAITLKELQSIQSSRKKSVKAAQRLLDIVIKQSGNVFSCFLDALKETGQQHVYEDIVSGVYRGTKMVCYRA